MNPRSTTAGQPKRPCQFRGPAAGVACLLLAIAAGSAQAGIWLDFNKQVIGEDASKAYREWIAITGYSFRGDPLPRGPADPLPEVSLTLIKGIDRATPVLFDACTDGREFPKATIDFQKPAGTGSPAVDFCRVELEKVIVVSQQMRGLTSEALPSEEIKLAFGKISYSYFDSQQREYYANYDYVLLQGAAGADAPPTPDPDSDHDGMLDAWEITYGLSVGTNDAGGDLDGDGFTNLEEYQLGTHPKSGASFFKATLTLDPATPAAATVTWNALAGKTYLVEWSPDASTAFTTVDTVTAASANGSSTVPATAALGFYRVRLQP